MDNSIVSTGGESNSHIHSGAESSSRKLTRTAIYKRNKRMMVQYRRLVHCDESFLSLPANFLVEEVK